MLTPIIVTVVVVLVGGVVFTLLWWRIADRWADAEHKRFRPRSSRSREPIETIVVRGGPSADTEPRRTTGDE